MDDEEEVEDFHIFLVSSSGFRVPGLSCFVRANLGGENRGGGKLGGMVGNWDKKGGLGRMA